MKVRLFALMNVLAIPFVLVKYPKEFRRYLYGTLQTLWSGKNWFEPTVTFNGKVITPIDEENPNA